MSRNSGGSDDLDPAAPGPPSGADHDADAPTARGGRSESDPQTEDLADTDGGDAGAYAIDEFDEVPTHTTETAELDTYTKIDRLPSTARSIIRHVLLVVAPVGALFVVAGIAFWEVPTVPAVLALIILALVTVQVSDKRAIRNLVRIVKSIMKDDKK